MKYMLYFSLLKSLGRANRQTGPKARRKGRKCSVASVQALLAAPSMNTTPVCMSTYNESNPMMLGVKMRLCVNV